MIVGKAEGIFDSCVVGLILEVLEVTDDNIDGETVLLCIDMTEGLSVG